MKSLSNCPSFALISSAVNGNEMAIEEILGHYDAYISKACLRPLYDEYGNEYTTVDTELKGRMRTAIIEMILKFRMEIV